MELLEYRKSIDHEFSGSIALRYNNFKYIHIFTLAHSGTCVAIAIFVSMILRRNTMFEKKQYHMVLGLTLFVSVLYFAALLTIVVGNTTSMMKSDPFVLI